MHSEKEIIKISKFLSLVLRHRPETIGIELDTAGWTDVAALISKSKQNGIHFDFEILLLIVATNNKKRFSFNDTFDRIRASQGHSVEVELGYIPQTPPFVLYHGTAEKSTGSILKTGLEKRNRNHVHLSSDLVTAVKVGQRHGKPFVFSVNTDQMHQDKFKFFLSENGVWLTDHVPPQYLTATVIP